MSLKGLYHLWKTVLIVSQLSGSEQNTITIIRDQKYVEEKIENLSCEMIMVGSRDYVGFSG